MILLPPDAPARLFSSLTLDDAEINSMNDLKYNEDGAVTLHIDPERPDGAENWLQTVLGKGWFALLRWYGPTQDFFDRNYKPGDFVRVD